MSTTNSNGFTDQLGPTTFNGAPVTFTTTVSVAGITVAPDGALSVTATLAAGSYTARAPTPTASVTPAPGATPSRSPASTFLRVLDLGSVEHDQLQRLHRSARTTTFNGAPVTFTTTVSVAGITVAPDGALSVTATLAAGSYTVSGTDADGIGDTGTWSYTLTVTGVNIPRVLDLGQREHDQLQRLHRSARTDHVQRRARDLYDDRLGRRHHGRARRRAQRHGDLGRGQLHRLGHRRQRHR